MVLFEVDSGGNVRSIFDHIGRSGWGTTTESAEKAHDVDLDAGRNQVARLSDEIVEQLLEFLSVFVLMSWGGASLIRATIVRRYGSVGAPSHEKDLGQWAT